MKRKLIFMVMPALVLALCLIFAGCIIFLDSNPDNEDNPIPLTNGVWTQGNLPSNNSAVWYSFEVTSNQTYYVWVRELLTESVTAGQGYAAVLTSAKYKSGASIFENSYSGINATTAATATGPASNFTATQSGTVLVKVSAITTGIFKVAYSTSNSRPEGETGGSTPPAGSEANPISLTTGEWKEVDDFTAGGEIWYSASVTNGTAYDINWDDDSDGSGQETADIAVSAKYQGESTFIFTDVDDGYITGQTFTANKDGTVLIRVKGKTATDAGTFAIKIEAKQAALGSEANPIPLTSGEWEDESDLTAGAEIWYSISVTDETVTNIYWDDDSDGSGQETADIAVSAKYQGESTFIFTDVDEGYTTGQTFTANKDGTVLIRVKGKTATDTGSFAIVYTTGQGVKPSIVF